MTFCTVCASPLAPTAAKCPACGASPEARFGTDRSKDDRNGSKIQSALLRTLYLAPFIVVFLAAASFVQRETEHQSWLASAYAVAQNAAAAGDLVLARDSFSDIVGYRDAEGRAKEMRARLAPLEADYAEGLRAIERGEYSSAVELLEPVAQQVPKLLDVTIRLDDAKRLLAEELRREVDAAETVRDWPVAEQTLRQLTALAPDGTESRSRLATLQREHGPLVLGRDRTLWLVSPDGTEERQLTDSHQVIWPTWSPDRSQIAFLAPDPDDPMGNVSLFTIGIDGAAPTRLVDGVSAHAAPVWSPDGTRIAYTSFAGYDPVYESGSIGVRIVDLATGEETDVSGSGYSLAFNPSWSPDGAELAFIVKYQGMSERPQHSSGDVMVAELGQEGFENLTNGAVRHVWSVAWSPQGESLLLYSLFGQTWYEPPSTSIRVLDRPTGKIDQVAEINEQPTPPIWSPDGTRFAFTVDENRIVFADTQGNRESRDASEALSGEMTWSPDGQAVLFAPWNADAPSTLVEITGEEQSLSTIRLEFDASPPFISPPQWAPAVAIPPEENPNVIPPTADTNAGS